MSGNYSATAGAGVVGSGIGVAAATNTNYALILGIIFIAGCVITAATLLFLKVRKGR